MSDHPTTPTTNDERYSWPIGDRPIPKKIAKRLKTQGTPEYEAFKTAWNNLDRIMRSWDEKL